MPSYCNCTHTTRARAGVFLCTGKRAALRGDSDDDGQPNTYDYDDSFIDDEDAGM